MSNFALRYVKDYYRTDEAAQVFGVHANTIRNWSDSGRLLCLQTPTGYRKIPLAEMIRHGASYST